MIDTSKVVQFSSAAEQRHAHALFPATFPRFDRETGRGAPILGKELHSLLLERSQGNDNSVH